MSDREIIIVLGQSGMGKSTWTKRYSEDATRLCVWDPKRSFPGVDYPIDPAEWWESHTGQQHFRVGSSHPKHAEDIGSIAFSEQRCMLILEECGLLFHPRADLPEWAAENIYTGREREITVIALAQRPKSINIGIRSQATRIVSFRQREIRDIEWLEECFDPDEILNLEKLTCLDFDVNTSQVSRYTVPIPKARSASDEQSTNLEE